MADALVGGEVIFTIGEQTYKTSINDAGQYQISLDIANADTAQPFTAIATGVASNDWVQMAALYPSITKLRELAGNDGALDATEYLGVNISAMTTAEYALVLSRELPVGTDAERKYALLQNIAEDQIARAAFMQKMLTDINMDLPTKYKTTLDMLMDYEHTRGQINILQASGDSFDSEIAEIQNDPLQTQLSNKVISGKFLVSSYGFYYLLDLNENGTGHLLTSNTPGGQIWAADSQYRESSFTWVRKGADIKITLDATINYGKTYGVGSEFLQACAQSDNNSSLQDCTVTMNSMVVSLITETEVSKFVDITLDVTLVNSAGDTVVDLSTEKYKATLFDRSQLYKFTQEELDGYEWFAERYSYAFNADGTAIQTNHLTKVETTVNWQLDDGFVTLEGDTLMLLPIHPTGPGFTAIRLLGPSNNPSLVDAAVKPVLLIKREPVNMAESDWVGRWNRVANHSFYSAIDYYANHVFRDGFETQALGSWSLVSNSHVRGYSNGSWRMEHELLAIHDGQHYMQYCYGNESDDFKPTNCLLEAYVIDKTFTGTTFWENWSRPLFQEADTLRQWQFGGSYDLQRQLPDGSWPTFTYAKVASNLLFVRDTGKVLEMLSSDKDSISVCEYDAFSECDKGTIYNLTRGLEMKITVAGDGSVHAIANGTGSLMFPKLDNFVLFLNPSPGSTFTANNIVSDCNGDLVGDYYTIPARETDCEVSVTFTPIP
ncbi:MAG: hypothetical protein K0Q67_1636 [Cellvibrio sp.]|nr:hypothetical protein [Cellvibrio sp.]